MEGTASVAWVGAVEQGTDRKKPAGVPGYAGKPFAGNIISKALFNKEKICHGRLPREIPASTSVFTPPMACYSQKSLVNRTNSFNQRFHKFKKWNYFYLLEYKSIHNHFVFIDFLKWKLIWRKCPPYNILRILFFGW